MAMPSKRLALVGDNYVKQLRLGDDFKVQKAKFAGSRSRWPAPVGGHLATVVVENPRELI